MFDSSFLKNIAGMWTSLVGRTTKLEDGQKSIATSMLQNIVYPYEGVSGSDGVVVVDYSALKLTKPPRIAAMTRLASGTEVPVFCSLLGQPTATSARISVKRITSILSLGLVPQYTGVSGITVEIYVRPAV